MQIPQQRFMFVLLAAAVLTAHPAIAADCVRSIAAKSSGPRTVALVGGDSWQLFREYLAAMKARDLGVSPWKVQAVVQLSGKQETLELGWGKMLTGESAEKLWERALSGKQAEASAELIAQAASSNWDVMCGAAAVRKPPPPPPPPPPGPSVTKPFAEAGEALIYFKSGVQYSSRRDYSNALREFKAAEKRNKDFPGLLMNIGVTYMQLGDYVRASDYLTRAVAQNPGDASARLNMACLQARLGQRADAIASLAAAKANGLKMTDSVRNDRDLVALRGRKDFEALFRTTEN